MSESTPGGLKWTYYDSDVLPAWVAETDYALAPAITKALHRAVDEDLTGYPYPQAEEATFVAATRFWKEHLDWAVDPTWLFSAPDVIEGTRRSIELLTRPRSPVVLHTPVYFPFFGMVERAGREIIEVPSNQDDDGTYRLDLGGIDRAMSDGAGSIVLCNPWNPVGRVLSAEEIASVVEIAGRHGGKVISDEIHAPITYPSFRHIPASTVVPETVVTVMSASKMFDIPGLKCAQVLLTNADDRDRWRRYFTPDKVGVGTFGLIASTAAYADSDDWYRETMARLNVNRLTLQAQLMEKLPRVRATELQGTYLAWLDFSSYALDDPAEFLLAEARVALTGGGQFRGNGSQHARLNIATTEERLLTIVERMRSALDQLH